MYVQQYDSCITILEGEGVGDTCFGEGDDTELSECVHT